MALLLKLLLFVAVVAIRTRRSNCQHISLLSQDVSISIKDRYACIVYSFHFHNSDRVNAHELSYRITLDPNAFISYFVAIINGFELRGVVKEKAEAEQEYTDAVEMGLNAVLVSQDSDANVFNIETNIGKNSAAIIAITAEQYILRRFSFYELSLFIDNEFSLFAINNQINGTRFSIELIDSLAPISAANTDVILPLNKNDLVTNVVSSHETQMAFNIPATNTESGIQFVLRYQTTAMLNNHQFLYDSSSLTFLHIFSFEDRTQLPRRVVFVLDQSGSMSGTKWDQAVIATVGALTNLVIDSDKFGLILFSSGVNKYDSGAIRTATTAHISAAIAWIESQRAGGSTNINQGILDAIAMIQGDLSSVYPFEYVNQILFVSDGEATAGVTNSYDIQSNVVSANDLLLSPASIFTFGIGADTGINWVTALNYPLLRSIALENGGFDARIKKSDTEDDLNVYYQLLQSPVLSFGMISYAPLKNIQIATVTKSVFRGLYAGTDIVIAGKLVPVDGGSNTINASDTGIVASVFGYRSREVIEEETTVQLSTMDVYDSGAANGVTSVEKTWAYLLLKTLSEIIHNPFIGDLGRFALGSTLEIIESQALNLGLRYSLITPWTSMIVVEERYVIEGEYVPDADAALNGTSTSDNSDSMAEEADGVYDVSGTGGMTPPQTGGNKVRGQVYDDDSDKSSMASGSQQQSISLSSSGYVAGGLGIGAALLLIVLVATVVWCRLRWQRNRRRKKIQATRTAAQGNSRRSRPRGGGGGHKKSKSKNNNGIILDGATNHSSELETQTLHNPNAPEMVSASVILNAGANSAEFAVIELGENGDGHNENENENTTGAEESESQSVSTLSRGINSI